MRRSFLFLLLFIVLNQAMAQFAIDGRVTDENQTPVEFAIISLQLDSIQVDHAITDSLGVYHFENLKAGRYRCLFQHVAYQDTMLSIEVQENTRLDLQYQGSLLLSTAVVTAKKPVLQREIDRIRFNVANTDIVFGSNIWEVIEKTPLVRASEDGGLEISGTTGAAVYINNRKKVLRGAALMNYLKSIPAENLESIEVITAPPSRYDAEGGAGIINIVMKKNEEEGLIGSAGLSARQTTVNSQAGSIYLNYREGKWNLYSTAYLSNRKRRTTYKKNILYPTAEYDLNNRSVKTINDFQILYPGANLGIDHQINKNHVVGLLFDYSGDQHDEVRTANSIDVFNNIDSLTRTENIEDRSTNTYSLNLNYQGKLDSSGKSLTIDLDALEYRSTDRSVSKTDVLFPETDGFFYTRDWFRSASPQQISNQSIRIDYESPVSDAFSFDLGAKASFSTIDNDLLFEDRIEEDVWVKDPLRSNLFKYEENIYALYAIIDHKLNPKWSYQLGARLENTVAKGWLEGEKVVDRNYINIFPTAYLRYSANEKNSFVLSVTSRITRPSFWDVNPFRLYTTDRIYFEGNPFLLPSRYYREEFNYTLHSNVGTFIFQTGASQLFDEFYALPYNPGGEVIANRKVNYGNKYAYFQSGTYSSQVLPWWRITGSALAAYVVSKGNYGDNIVIDNQSFLVNLSANQSFTLSKKRGLSLTVITQNTLPVTIVNTRIGNRLVTEVRLRKSMGPLNVTLSATDFFKSNKDRYTIDVNDLTIIDENYHDTQSVALALSYSFGKSTVKARRYRSAGNDDEQGRLR